MSRLKDNEGIEDWEDKKNFVRAFEQLHEYDVRHALSETRIYDHKYYAFIAGMLFFDFTYRFQFGGFIWFYLLGLAKLLKDSLKKPEKNLNSIVSNMVIYYLVGALIMNILWLYSHGTIPEITPGIYQNTLGVIT